MIIRVTVAWTTLVVGLLVGLPLSAVAVSRWHHWDELRPGRDRDPWGEVARRHRLTPQEVHQLTQHLAMWGAARPLADPVLRAAAVDWAQAQLAGYEERRSGALGTLFWLADSGHRRSSRAIARRYGSSAVPVRQVQQP